MKFSKRVQIGYEDNGTSVMAVEPDYSKFDSVADIIRDAARWGLLEELRELLCGKPLDEEGERLAHYRDVAYELASAKDRNLSIDLLIRVTGVDAFGANGLRDYALKHGCSHEFFREQAEALRERLRLGKQRATNQLSKADRHAA